MTGTVKHLIRDWSLNTGRGGGVQNGRGGGTKWEGGGTKWEGGASEVLPLRKGGGEKVLTMLKGGTKSFRVAFTQ